MRKKLNLLLPFVLVLLLALGSIGFASDQDPSPLSCSAPPNPIDVPVWDETPDPVFDDDFHFFTEWFSDYLN